ncbi:hypothetical protein JYT34_00585 [Olleya sp. AH-315-K02]|nr:hypothetical protein [Olleya sp. AH-315-K02]
MKTKLISIVTLLMCISVSAQILNYDKELERMVSVPNTPEALAFGKYGNTSVSMYSGTPNISIPIYTILGRELNLPINLSYDATGVKVSQLASNVGLNWNLNVGGRISRTVNGLVDGNLSIVGSSYTSFYNNSNISVGGNSTGKTLRQLIADNLNPPSSFTSRYNAETYFKFLKDVSDNQLETQPDYFSFNAFGYSDTFVYNLDYIPNDPNNPMFVSLDNPRTKVIASFTGQYISSWIVTLDNGTKLYFIKAEITESTNDGTAIIVQNYNSSWLLTQLESPNKKDIYQFSYSDLGLSNTQPYVLVSAVNNQMNDNNPPNTFNETLQTTTYRVSQQVLSQIIHNGKVVVNVALKSRNDFNLNSAIDNIKIIKPDATTLKKYVFNHSYFGDTNSNNAFDKRLKLDSITIQSAANNTLSSYIFDYFSPEDVPSRESLSRDYLGLYNGKSNTVLYPEVTVNSDYFSGADRSADFNQAIVGTLKTITYPTKGYTEFLYEANTTPYNIDDITTSTQDVNYGSLTILGGNDDGNSNNPSGACAIDQYGHKPKLGSISFNITEAGNYDIEYSNSNGGDGEAYLFKRSPNLNYGTIGYDSVIDQSNCNELVTMDWLYYAGSDGDIVYLTPGTYQIQLAKGYIPSGSGNIHLKVHREEVISNGIIGTGALSRAGIRVKTIKDYDHTNVLATEKEYQYTTTLNGSDSSGEFMFEPQFYTTSTYQVYIDSPDASKGQIEGLNTLTSMTRVNSWSGGDRPHIAYPKVYEIQKATGLNNGYVEHLFNVGWYNGVFSTGVTPGANLYFNDYEIGKEKQTNIYKADNTLIQTDSTSYNSPIYFGNSTLYIKNNIQNTFSYVNIYEVSSTEFRYSYDTAIFTGFNYEDALSGGGINPSKPSSCFDGLDDNCMPLTYGSLGTLQTYAQGRIGGVLSNTSISYSGGVATTQTTGYTYDTSGNYLLRDTQTMNSKGETITSKLSYPEDFTGLPYTTMVSENRLTNVIQTESLNGSTSLFTQKSPYVDLGVAILPTKIQTAKGTTLEDRILFERYDDDNLVQVKQEGGTSTAYIWGYNKRYVVAKIVNTIYADIENLTAFGSGFTLTNGLSSTQKTALRGLSGAEVTTYDYDPMVGVTSITDPNGQTIYYEYDEFNRLEYIKDKNSKILSQNQYNYKN